MYAIRSYYAVIVRVIVPGIIISVWIRPLLYAVSFSLGRVIGGKPVAHPVITSYSIHYTKLYEMRERAECLSLALSLIAFLPAIGFLGVELARVQGGVQTAGGHSYNFV